jgi:hypothetical protein
MGKDKRNEELPEKFTKWSITTPKMKTKNKRRRKVVTELRTQHAIFMLPSANTVIISRLPFSRMNAALLLQ